MSSLTPSTATKRERERDPKPKSSSLADKLAAVLPQGFKFAVHHLSTPPTRTSPLCSAPPNERPDKTYWESHFLAVSIDPHQNDAAPPLKRASPGADEAKDPEPKRQVLVFAVEIIIFTTAFQTTFFVSKADSTGYLPLLNLPKGTPSPIRHVTSTFLAYLVVHRRRKNTQLVVNLFARSQAQYLFPGSAENKGKHVLDDWGLVRWWCRVLNPLLESQKEESWGTARGYLIVPGLEETEMRAFIPRTPGSATNWIIGHPMERISHYTREFDWVPPRCLIPRYPDDPKSRFRDELDEEASKWKQSMGAWKSVKTLGQFWEMMAFRQECSSGQLTGFIWLVFDPIETVSSSQAAPESPSSPKLPIPSASFESSLPTLPPATPPRRRVDISANTPQSSPLKLFLATPAKPSEQKPNTTVKKQKKQKKKKLTGSIVPRPPKVKTQQRNYVLDRPTTTAFYYWPTEGRGDKILDESDYKRAVDLLLHLDFSSLDKATSSTRRWISEAGMGAKWGYEVAGKRASSVGQANGGGRALGNVTNLTGLVRKKSALAAGDPVKGSDSAATETQGARAGAVNVLGAGLVRKKKKEGEPVALQVDDADTPKVNMLGAGLVRKKPKVA
ncbi:histone acetylation protein-domain-containing protein [Podospora appendiculata]|uniref:histone acetyltransferase n=1 Tax=Podospora appendiculata TaxID=314037 RepID=A0AAE0X6U3_9PEZI|nr:histone acetylation protein-domain-containing protein [Podospora appendiculata]